MSWYHPSSLLDKIFEGGIIIKGVIAVLEFLGGLLLFFVSPARLQHFIAIITQQELIEDPHDKLIAMLITATRHFTSGSQVFLVVYLWLHAVIKLIAVIGILRNKLWAYPFSLITLGLFMAYQLYSIFTQATAGMIILTIFDAAILWLIGREYGKVRSINSPAD